MPYIEDSHRSHVRRHGPSTVGELTYSIQQTLHDYISRSELSYRVLAECLGALEGAKIDLAERVLRPYEESKRAANGDVWDDDVSGGVQ